MSVIEKFDEKKGYCRKLGHHLTFQYCRSVSDGLPCPMVLDCWYGTFPVADFIEQQYSREEIKAFLVPPKPKLTSILDHIKKAQERNG